MKYKYLNVNQGDEFYKIDNGIKRFIVVDYDRFAVYMIDLNENNKKQERYMISVIMN